MGEPDARHDRHHKAAAFFIPEERLLPPVCPQCGAAGSVPALVPTQHAARTLQVHLCDLCAAHAARQATLRFAWITGAVVLSMSVASALTLGWGERGRILQFVVLLLISLGLGRLAHARSRATSVRLSCVALRVGPGKPDQHVLSSTSPWLNQALVRLGFEQLDGVAHGPAQRALTGNLWSRLAPALPAVLSCAWWLALHGLARASVYVVNMGPGPVILLVDDRRHAMISATRFEQPNLGYHHELVAGSHKVSLVTASGQSVYSGEQRLLPGQTLLITRMLPESCLWQERLDYEHPGSPSVWSLLARSTQAVLLHQPVDAWFTPLRDGSTPPTPTPPSVPLAEAAAGTRLAVRLLSCPAP